MKTWPIIRHIRYFILQDRVFRHARKWSLLGLGLGYPNPSDIEHLNRIWEGLE